MRTKGTTGRRWVRRAIITATSSTAFFLAWGPSLAVQHEVEPLTQKERFGLELQACMQARADKKKPSACELYGKIKFVENFPDVTVKAVENFPDIKVKLVENFPDKPGKWKIVENFPDYKVKLVENFPDYKIKFVDNFPGCD